MAKLNKDAQALKAWAVKKNCTKYTKIAAKAESFGLNLSNDSIWALVNFIKKTTKKDVITSW